MSVVFFLLLWWRSFIEQKLNSLGTCLIDVGIYWPGGSAYLGGQAPAHSTIKLGPLLGNRHNGGHSDSQIQGDLMVCPCLCPCNNVRGLTPGEPTGGNAAWWWGGGCGAYRGREEQLLGAWSSNMWLLPLSGGTKGHRCCKGQKTIVTEVQCWFLQRRWLSPLLVAQRVMCQAKGLQGGKASRACVWDSAKWKWWRQPGFTIFPFWEFDIQADCKRFRFRRSHSDKQLLPSRCTTRPAESFLNSNLRVAWVCKIVKFQEN